MARFDEYVAVLDGAMRANGKPYSYEGEWYRVRDLPTAPGPVRGPRPPIIVGGQAPSILRRSMLLWDTTDPTLPGNTLPDLVARFTDAGIHDFVLGWLTPKDGDTLTHLAEEVIPDLR